MWRGKKGEIFCPRPHTSPTRFCLRFFYSSKLVRFPVDFPFEMRCQGSPVRASSPPPFHNSRLHLVLKHDRSTFVTSLLFPALISCLPRPSSLDSKIGKEVTLLSYEASQFFWGFKRESRKMSREHWKVRVLKGEFQMWVQIACMDFR